MSAQQILLPLLRTDALSASSYLVGVDADDPGSIDCNCNCLEDSIPSAPPSISIPFSPPPWERSRLIQCHSHRTATDTTSAGILVLHQVLVEPVFRRKSEQILSQLRQSALLHQQSSFVLRLWMRQFPPQLRQSNPHLDQEKVRSIISELEQLLPHIASIYTGASKKVRSFHDNELEQLLSHWLEVQTSSPQKEKNIKDHRRIATNTFRSSLRHLIFISFCFSFQPFF